MITTQLGETSVTNNSLSKDNLHLDDHAKQIIMGELHLLVEGGL